MKGLASLSFVVVIALAAAAGDQAVAAKKAIVADYASISKAFAAKDFKTLASFLADDFKAYPSKGDPITKDDVTKDFSQEREQLTNVKWVRKVLKFGLSGGVAHVSVEGIMSGKLLNGRAKGHVLTVDAHSEDTWVKVGKDWRIQQTKLGSMNTLLDGKLTPMRHS